MSEVISFRLDKTNPREARALEVLNSFIEQGYSTRFILTKALLGLDHPGLDSEMSQDDRDFRFVLSQLGHLIQNLEANPIPRQSINSDRPILNDSFLASVKQGAKPGIKVG